ncbi:DUF1688 family protein [Roseibium suaedae]|uniref:DUF1688 family protein n=1 Tax=Roseibium suaedae TaxID=735517 RepID=A0A1M7A0T4_9HYPH|nr:DUF1688 family protein [Roseibium suaedae]SHL36219.1 Protein of unknown function [Roseibium suaedae]
MTAPDLPSAAIRMLSAAEVKTRTALVAKTVLDGLSQTGVSADLEKLEAAADLAEKTMTGGFPDLQLPPHGCWRFFELDGLDRWAMLASAREFASAEEMLRCAGDLVILASVLNVRTPEGWRFEEQLTGRTYQGAAGRAIAALTMFAAGSFSAEPEDPLRLDAHALIRLEADEIAAGLQLDPDAHSDLIRDITHHLKRLGEAIGLRPDLFERDESTRPGHLLEQLWADAEDGMVSAAQCLELVLDGLSPLWQGGESLNEVLLGDCWQHSRLLQEGDAPGLVPFHLPALEITYSFLEPLAWAGVLVSGLEDLPGLADLTHVFFFLETGVLTLQSGREGTPLSQQDALDRMIELRATALVLLEKLASLLRGRMEASSDELPLTCLMAAATLPAAREIAGKNPVHWDKAANSLGGGGVFWLPFGA